MSYIDVFESGGCRLTYFSIFLFYFIFILTLSTGKRLLLLLAKYWLSKQVKAENIAGLRLQVDKNGIQLQSLEIGEFSLLNYLEIINMAHL